MRAVSPFLTMRGGDTAGSICVVRKWYSVATQAMSEEIKKEHIKGKYGIAQTSITAVVTLIAAIITGVVAYRVGAMQVNADSVQNSLEAEDRIAALEQRLADLHEEVSTLEKDRDGLQSKNEATQRDYAKLQSDYAKLSSDYATARAEIDNLRNQLDNPLQEKASGEESSSNTNPVTAPSVNTENTQMQIPDDAVYHNGHAYKAYSESLTWTNAKLYCESLGGHLATITDIQESIFITDYLTSIEFPRNGYWIGLHCESNRQWYWITGETYNFKNWATNEPNNSSYTKDNENCVHLYGKNEAERRTGEWNDTTERGAAYADRFYNYDYFGLLCEWDIN